MGLVLGLHKLDLISPQISFVEVIHFVWIQIRDMKYDAAQYEYTLKFESMNGYLLAQPHRVHVLYIVRSTCVDN